MQVRRSNDTIWKVEDVWCEARVGVLGDDERNGGYSNTVARVVSII